MAARASDQTIISSITGWQSGMRQRQWRQRWIKAFGNLILIALAAGVEVSSSSQGFSTEYAFVVSTDYYSAAYYSTIEVEPPRTKRINIGTVSTDPIVHYDHQENMVLVVNRYLADNIQVIDPLQGFATIAQYSVGNGSNPHDIRIANSQKAYVTRYELTTLLMVHPYSGFPLGTIDLSVFADSDGIPEMDRMEIVGKRLFVTLNIIDHTTWLPAGPGKVAVIDVETDTIIDCDPFVAGTQPILLPFQNPITEMRYEPCSGKLIVGCMSSWGDRLGGAVAIDPIDLTVSTITTEEALNGDLVDVLITPDQKGYAIVLDSTPWPQNYARLVAFDPKTGIVTDTLYIQTSGMGSSLGNMEANRQREIYLCDRDLTSPGVRIYDTRDNSLITKIDVGVPPFDLEFVQIPWAGVTPNDSDGEILVSPNPASREFRIWISRSSLGESNIGRHLEALTGSIYDTRGKRIATIDLLHDSNLTISGRWDCRDWQGCQVGPGVYFLRVNGFNKPARLIVIR